MAVTASVFYAAMGNIGNGNIDLDSHTFKAVLSNIAPVVAYNDELADITQIANGNGYTTGGVALTSVTWVNTSGSIWRFSSADFEWQAVGGSIGPFRYIVIYDDTATGDKLFFMYDFGSAITIPDGSFFRVEVGANGHVRYGIGVIS